jgi:hypothetical protein
MKIRVLWLMLLCALSGHAFAEVKFKDSLEVMRIGTYHHGAAHFVWFSASIPECATPLSFNETQPGGKALFATLTVALVNKRKVGVRYEGCDIIEVYLN